MPTNLAIDDRLLEEAQKVGGHRTKRETVNSRVGGIHLQDISRGSLGYRRRFQRAFSGPKTLLYRRTIAPK